MEVCADDTDLTLQNRLSAAIGPPVNNRGHYTFRQIDAFSEALATNIANEANTNPIAIAVAKYGGTFNEGRQIVNSFLRTCDAKEYPKLCQRIEEGQISALEYAAFLGDYNLTPIGCTNKSLNNPSGLLLNLEQFYNGSYAESSLGGLCAQMPAFFSKIDAFFTLIGEIEGLIDDALTFLAKIRDLDNIIQEAIQKLTVKALIEKLTKTLTEGLMKVFEKIQSAIENFNIEDVIGDVSTFINEQLIKNIMTQKEKMCLFFNEDTKKTIKEKFKQLIDYAVGMFENPNIEEIQYLISRFCAFVFNIEALMNQVKGPLDNFANKYTNIATRLKTISNINTSSAIRKGAIRMSDEKKKELIEKQEEKWYPENGKAITPTGEEPINVKKITIKEYSTLPSCKKVRDGSDGKIGISGDWIEDKECGLAGYVNIDLDVKVYLVRLTKDVGKIEITSGWRGQQYNKKIEASPESPHMSGLVVDIKDPGVEEEEFVKLATKAGFKFIKRLDSGDIHLDTRKRPQ